MVQALTSTTATATQPAKPGYDITIDGITALAQARANELVARAMATNETLKKDVESIDNLVTFEGVGLERCEGGGFGSHGPGTALGFRRPSRGYVARWMRTC